eukprot:3472069-Prorocentrum_lima.AAC.1
MDDAAAMRKARPEPNAGGPEPTLTGGTATGLGGEGLTAKALSRLTKAKAPLPKERFDDDIDEWKRLPQ